MTGPDTLSPRQALMQVCAQATLKEMQSALVGLDPLPEASELRSPEIGMVMLRGRIGGTGAPFNVGEATVSRAVVKIASGEIGHAYILGRAPERARCAALLDALGQCRHRRARIDEIFVTPVTARLNRERDTALRRTAATRVNFFTLARGED